MVSVILPVATNLNLQSFKKKKISLTCHFRVFSPRRSERWVSCDDPSGFSKLPCRFRTAREQYHANKCESLTADTLLSFRRCNRSTWTSRSIFFTRRSNLLGKVFFSFISLPLLLSYNPRNCLTFWRTASVCGIDICTKKKKKHTALALALGREHVRPI